MTVRISKELDSGVTVIRVEGRLESNDVATLDAECREVTGPAALELSKLRSTDTDGVRALRKVISLGIEVRGASKYIELLLKQDGNEK